MSVSVLFLQAKFIQFLRNRLSLVIQIVDVPAALVRDLKNGPNGLALPFPFVTFVLGYVIVPTGRFPVSISSLSVFRPAGLRSERRHFAYLRGCHQVGFRFGFLTHHLSASVRVRSVWVRCPPILLGTSSWRSSPSRRQSTFAKGGTVSFSDHTLIDVVLAWCHHVPPRILPRTLGMFFDLHARPTRSLSDGFDASFACTCCGGPRRSRRRPPPRRPS